MILLNTLLQPLTWTRLSGDPEALRQPISFITCDSRQVQPGALFVALRGEAVDGHHYVNEVLKKGCSAVIVEHELADLEPSEAVIVTTPDTHQALGLMAAAFHGQPARQLTLIGITGTNGKTTTSRLLEEILLSSGYRPGVIGTINYRYCDRAGHNIVVDAPLTTPDPLLLHGLLRQMADQGVTHVIMEVSSHSLVQKRLAGLSFAVAVFTNLSRDHLDYHGTMADYFAAKQLLFQNYLRENGVAVITTDHDGTTDWGGQLADILRSSGSWRAFSPAVTAGKRLLTCGLTTDCDIFAAQWSQDRRGSTLTLEVAGSRYDLCSPLTGRFNILNMLGAAAVGQGLGLALPSICQGLARVRNVSGRLERVELPAEEYRAELPTVFVDYAHTPDALEKVLRTLAQLKDERLICIFGCGGDRDRGKRPLMGEIAGRLADLTIITTDNPRREDAASIIAEIEQGLVPTGAVLRSVAELFAAGSDAKGYCKILDRITAIQTGCSLATRGDILLIAGKGHETYQIIGREKKFLDDRLEALSGLLGWNLGHLLRATGGRLLHGLQVAKLGAIITDSRKVGAGDIFVAIKGDNFDGHDYVRQAIAQRAATIIVEHQVAGADQTIPMIVVADSLRALGDLAGYRRRLLGKRLRVIGLTGSSGKTTVKEMASAIFAVHYQADNHEHGEKSDAAPDPLLKNPGNFNNLIGLPLSLLPVAAHHRLALLEMGMNRPGEIGRLAEIADPDIGCITNVHPAHLEGLGSVEGVARAKSELFQGMRPEAIRVVNLDDPHLRHHATAPETAHLGFASTPEGCALQPRVWADDIHSLGEGGMHFILHIEQWQHVVTLGVPGQHNVANATAAAALAFAAGVVPEKIVQGLERHQPVHKRLERADLPGVIKIVNDAYNANPASMAAALRTVSTYGHACRRAAALGDMLELGHHAPQAHYDVGRLAAQLGYDYLALTGQYAGEMARGASDHGLEAGRIRQCADHAAMAEWLIDLIANHRLQQDDWLLIKGSRGMRMELLLEKLSTHYSTPKG